MPFLFGKPPVKNTFFKSFPIKRSDDESQESGFGFDLKSPPKMRILWIHDPFLELPPKTHNPFFLDSEIRIWIFPKKRTLYVDGRCDSHTQFPRSPLGTPGTMNPPRIYWPPNTKKTKTACLFGLSLLRSPSKKGLHFKTLAPTEAQEKKGLHFQTLAPTEGQEKNGLHFQTLAPTEAQEKKACILRVSLRNKMTAFRK